MAQILLNRTLSYSKNFSITKNQSTLLKPSQIIHKPIIIRSMIYCPRQTPNHTKLTKTVSEDYVNKSYDSGGKILRNFINKIESMIYENNARLIGEPINIVFHVNNIQKFYRDEYKQFNQFNYNGKYIISVFDKDIEKYFKSHFPNLKIKIENTTLINSITITDYLNHDIILKESGIGI